jgi:acyl-homoserine-lactone acylase
MKLRLRTTAATALAAAVGLATVAIPATAQAGAPLEPPGESPRRATIHRTSYGIPHIVADDFESLGFGQGYAAAEDIACSLADTLLTARGQRSRYLGPDERYDDQVTLNASNLEVDALVTDLRNRGVVEELLADPERGPSDEVRAMVDGYIAGVNRHLDDVGGAHGISDPACKGAAWVEKGTPLDLWYGVFMANILASTGVFVPEIVNAAPPSEDGELGLPVAGPDGFAAVPAALPSGDELLAGLGRDPAGGFGSNGTALGGDVTTTGRGMLLGNPHFPWRGRYRFVQAHLTIPGHFDVAGGMLHGAPTVNIGWNADVAWTHTVSTAYRFTPYEYRYVPGTTTYLTEEGPRELERREVTITVREDDGSLSEVTEDLYRTDEGYVLDDPSVLMGWTPASFFALKDANADHLKTVDVFHEMSKAGNVAELLEAHDRTGGMPWVNTIAADRDGDALYADHSVVPNVPDDLVEECATPIGRVLFEVAGLPGLDGTRAQSDCAWRTDEDAPRPGIFGDGNLPEHVTRDWVINANDSYWLPNPDTRLEGFARIIGCERCERSLRTRMVYRYVLDRLDGSDGYDGPELFSHDQLKAIQYENRVFAAELAREGDDLQDVCEAAEGGEACEVLAGWDGRTDIDSVGAHIFRELWIRTAAGDRWEEGFDPERPVETPRDLDEGSDAIVQAMRDAIAFLEEEGIAFDAPLGELQLAADEGAPAIGVGGGLGQTGNANVIDEGNPAENTDHLYPISRGSSHMQAVAFTDEGVDAATILTYSQSTNPEDPNHADQTELFSQERWVDFPFTMAEIEADPDHTVTVVTDAGVQAAPTVGADPRPLPTTGGGASLAGLALVGAAALLRRRRAAA